MEHKNNHLTGQTWIGLVLILFCVGYNVLFFQARTPAQEFFYGVLVGLLIVLFGTFIYRAGKEYLGKRQ